MERLTVQQFSELMAQGYTVIDARQAEIFVEGFIEGAVSIPWDANFVHRYEELIDDDQKVIMVADEPVLPAIIEGIRLSGIGNIYGYLFGGFEAWKQAGKKFDLLITIEADEFAMDYQFDEFFLVDTRDKSDYEKEHVEDAENIWLSDLEPMLVEMDAEASYYVYSDTPAQAITAGSLFRKNEFHRIRAVAATYETIKTCGVPMFTQRKKPGAPPAGGTN